MIPTAFQLFLSPFDGKVFIIEELPDEEQLFDFLSAIYTMPRRRAVGLEGDKFRFPIPDHVGLHLEDPTDLADAEKAFGGISTSVMDWPPPMMGVGQKGTYCQMFNALRNTWLNLNVSTRRSVITISSPV